MTKRAAELLLSLSRSNAIQLSYDDWNNILDILDRHWIDSSEDIRLILSYDYTLELPYNLFMLIKLWDEDARNSTRSKIFKYSHDYDENGILYYLATDSRAEPWKNPVDRNIVQVRVSNLEKDSDSSSAILGLEAVRCVSTNEPFSWFEIEFLEHEVKPSCYTLRHYSSWDTECLRNWALQGWSDGGSTWVNIRTHNNDTALCRKGQSHSWVAKVKDTFFSKFRILQTGVNSNNQYSLALSGFEIYGELRKRLEINIVSLIPQSSFTKNFKYSKDFDTQGLLYFLGTSGLRQAWRNPVDLGFVKVDCSGLSTESVSEKHLVGREAVRLVTEPKENCWFSVEFLNCKIRPTGYSLRHYASWDTEVIRSWKLEGSNNRSDWRIIKEHIHDTSIDEQKGATFTWMIEEVLDHFSAFRILQTGKNSNSHFYLALSGFEVYGDAEFSDNAFVVDSKEEDHEFSSQVALSEFLGYSYDMDTNGLIYYVGSEENHSIFQNPCLKGLISISSSQLDVDSDPLIELCSRKLGSVKAKPAISAFILFKFEEHLIAPTHYFLRHQSKSSDDAVRNWVLEGWNENSKEWILLCEHINDVHLSTASSGHTWQLAHSPKQFFKSLRITQTAMNSSSRLNLCLGCVEFYGHVITVDLKRSSVKRIITNWDKSSSSSRLSVNGATVANLGSNNSWQCCRLDQSFLSGVCEATFIFEKSLPTTNSWKASVGLVPDSFLPSGKLQWLGSQGSWAYVAGTGYCCYNTSSGSIYGEPFSEGDVIKVIANYNDGQISFSKNGVSQGIAFSNLKAGCRVFPAVSLTGTGSSFRLLRFRNQDGEFDSTENEINSIVISEEINEPYSSSPWDHSFRTQDMVIDVLDSSMVTNIFDGNKWEMIRSVRRWNLSVESTIDFQVAILEDPPTKNKWRFLIGLCPSSFAVSSKPPVWLDKGCWAFIGGNGHVYYDDVKSTKPYCESVKKNDVVGVRIDNVAKTIQFSVNGVWGSALPSKSLDQFVHAAVCMTGQGASAQLRIKF